MVRPETTNYGMAIRRRPACNTVLSGPSSTRAYGARVPQPRGPSVEPPHIAVRTTLELARDKRHPLYACIHLIAYTGLRRGEASCGETSTWIAAT